MTNTQITERKRTKISSQNNEPVKNTHTHTSKPSPEDGKTTGFRNLVSFYCPFYVVSLYVYVGVFSSLFFCVGILFLHSVICSCVIYCNLCFWLHSVYGRVCPGLLLCGL